MQVVIEMSDDYYEILKYEGQQPNAHVFAKLVANGIVLPKGHGRLIDADALEKEIVNGIKAGLYEEGYEEYGHINDMDDCVDCVRYADTIIEADRSEE